MEAKFTTVLVLKNYIMHSVILHIEDIVKI